MALLSPYATLSQYIDVGLRRSLCMAILVHLLSLLEGTRLSTSPSFKAYHDYITNTNPQNNTSRLRLSPRLSSLTHGGDADNDGDNTMKKSTFALRNGSVSLLYPPSTPPSTIQQPTDNADARLMISHHPSTSFVDHVEQSDDEPLIDRLTARVVLEPVVHASVRVSCAVAIGIDWMVLLFLTHRPRVTPDTTTSALLLT